MLRAFLLFLMLIILAPTIVDAMPAYNPPLNLDEENYPIDRREFVRLKNKNMKIKLFATNSNGQNLEIIDFSRGGIAFANQNNFTQGENFTLNLKYGNYAIPVEANIIAIEKNKVRTKFINLDIPKQNKLFYLSSKIEYDNKWLKTKLSGQDGEEFFEWES